MSSLKNKLAIIIMLVSIIALGSVSYINYIKTENILENTLKQSAIDNANYNAKVINQWVEGEIRKVEDLARSSAIRSMNPNNYLPDLKQIANERSNYENFFVANKEGDGITTNDSVLIVIDRPYYKKVLQGETFVTSAMTSRDTNEKVFAIVVPVYKNNKGKEPIGMLGVNIKLSYLQNITKDMKLNGYGYGFIADSKKLVLSHPNSAYQGKLGSLRLLKHTDDRFDNLMNKMTKKSNGYGYYSIQGRQKVLAYAPIASTDWSVAQTANVSDIMSSLNEVKNINLAANAVAIALLLGVAIFIANYITKPLIKLTRTAEVIAEGNLNQQLSMNRNDEIGKMSDSFMKMVNNLKLMITEVKRNSEKLSAHSQELASSSVQVGTIIEEVSSTASEVSAISDNGAKNAKLAGEDSKQMQQVAKEGNNAVQESIEKINSIAKNSTHITEQVNKLGKHSAEVGIIINTITEIAEQTNLLALNAAIEAERAGEKGKGFAVVADEVRNLAEQSASSAKDITDLVYKIQEGIATTKEAVDNGTNAVDEGVKVTNNAGAALEKIIDATEENNSLIEDVVVGSEQTNKGMEQLTSTSQQTTATVQQLSGSAQELANISADLQKTVTKFKLD